MSTGNNEDKIFALNEQMSILEMKAEEFMQENKNYARLLNDFQNNMRRILYRKGEILENRTRVGGTNETIELETLQVITEEVNELVFCQAEESEDVSRKIRKFSEDERETLLQERNNVSWE